jgi:probable phosphoglycerate mutase
VRHGATEWSESGQHTGTTDIPLTDEGRRDAERLRERLAGRDFRRVLTSPLSRAHETARLAGFADAEPRDELREIDYGEYEGRTTPEIREEVAGWTVWRDGSPGGETVHEVGDRLDPLIAELREGEGDSLVFAHGHLLRIFAARWVDLPADHGARLGFSTAAVGVLGRERETPAIWLWNDVGQDRV